MIYAQGKSRLLRLLRVPPEPDDPMGDVAQLRVFRAAPGFLRYRLLTWTIGQAVVGLLALVIVAMLVGAGLEVMRREPLLGPLLIAAAPLVLVGYAAQLWVTRALVRLDYEMRFYKTSDRSLRVREGVWTVHEQTQTYANIQNITITQGPLERYFKIANVRVETAGGGSGQPKGQEGFPRFQGHVAVFRGVDNAEAIRDQIMEHLRRVRGTGLGDFDEERGGTSGRSPAAAASIPDPELFRPLLAALRDEARALRQAAEARHATGD